MKKFLLTHLIALGLLSYGQKASVSEGCLPLEVTFEAPATSSTYFWDFKNGVTSNVANPVNLFGKEGSYEVEFRESEGGPVLHKFSIAVYPVPDLDISPIVGCPPLNAQFKNISVVNPKIPVTDYKWVFHDATSFVGQVEPTRSYALGKYNVSLELRSPMANCSKTEIISNIVEVIEAPVVSISANPSISCKGPVDVTFTNTASGKRPLIYSWKFGNGSTSTDANPGAQKYNNGQFAPFLTVNYENVVGCAVTAATGVSVGAPVPKIVKTLDSACLGGVVRFSTSVSGIYAWDFGPSSIPATSNAQVVEVIFPVSGKQKVKLTVTSFDGQCSGVTADSIKVQELITADISPKPEYQCGRPFTVPFTAISNQTDVSYKWRFLHGEKDSVKNVNKTYTRRKDRDKYDVNRPDSIYAFVEITSNKSKCNASKEVLDVFYIPTSRITTDEWRGCAPLAINFIDGSEANASNPIVSWHWIFGDGDDATMAAGTPVNHVYRTPGVYFPKLEVITKRGCTDTSYTVRIEVGTDITSSIDFTADKSSVCFGEQVGLSVSKAPNVVSAYHFYANGSKLSHCSDESSASLVYNGGVTGSQDVSLMVDYNGCYSTKTKPGLIMVKSADAQMDFAAICSKPFDYTFLNRSKNATSLTWDFGDKASSTTTGNSQHTYTAAGNYIVRLTAQNANGCPATEVEELIHVRKIEAKIDFEDTLLCTNSEYEFDASASIGVEANCHTGYTWQFPTQNKTKRPYTSASSRTKFSFDDKQNGHNHEIKLIVKDINGCTDTAVAKVNIYDIRIKAQPTPTSICLPDTVLFTDLTTADTTLASWVWKFGDTDTSDLRNPEHSYKKTTLPILKYDVALTVKDTLGCQKTIAFPLPVYKPFTEIRITDRTLCLGDTAQMYAPDFNAGGSSLSYRWDFGDAAIPTSTKDSNRIVYKDAKAYNIKLVYQQNGSACIDSTTDIVEYQSKPVANFTTNVDGMSPICAVKNIKFTDATISQFGFVSYWNLAGTIVPDMLDPELPFDKGTHTFTHIVSTSFGCADTSARDIVLVRPDGRFEASKVKICKGDSILFALKDTADISSYAWYFGDDKPVNNRDSVTNVFNFHPKNGQAVVQLLLRGYNDACSYVKDTVINIHQVVADFQREADDKDTTICFNEPLYHLTNQSRGNDTYAWDFGDGQKSTTDKSPVHKYAKEGKYNVKLSVKSNALGCVDTLVKVAIVALNPPLKAVGDTICQGAGMSKLYVANPRYKSTYKWTPNTGLDKDNDTTVMSGVLHTTEYKVFELDSNKCEARDTVYANVVEPLPLVDWADTIVIGDEVTLPAEKTNLHIFKWNPSGGLSCIDCSFPKARPLQDTIYNLNVTDVLGCFNTDVVYTIKVRPETFVKMPTIFTPNSDGHNDLVHVNGWGIKELVEFKIFNRWGQMLYSSNNLTEGWDGKFNGSLQNSDVYVYKVKVKTWRDAEISQEGYINLVH